MKHLSWAYPIVCQTRKEDFVSIGKDVAGGEMISVKEMSKLSIIKTIWRKDVHAHGRGFPFPELTSIFAKKSIYSPHNDTIGMQKITRLIRRYAFNRYDKIIAQTEYGKQNLIKAGIKKNKIVIIPAAVDYDFFSKPSGGERFRKKHGLGKEPFVLAVGIRPLKNPLVIADACEKAGIKAVFIGPYKKQDLKKTWKSDGFDWYLPSQELLGKKNVVLAGQLNGKEYLEALDAATIFVNSSDYESFGLAVYEAAATGLPLCLPNSKTFNIFSECALFHKKTDSEELAKNIKTYMSKPKLISKNTKESKTISKSFDYTVVKDKYKKLYKTVGFM
ncbi:MAG: glycosyltransferase family 4 protein [Candidatus Aenigmatarchaeota archaeon]